MSKKNKILVNTHFSINEYLVAVSEIVDSYFITNIDEDGNVLSETYVPHIGMIGTMEYFYNHCIIDDVFKSKFIEEEQSEEEDDEETGRTNSPLKNKFDKIISDKEFIDLYNEALSPEDEYILDFSHAYADALDIINVKNNSIRYAVDTIKTTFYSVLNAIRSITSDKSLEDISNLMENLKDGEFNAEDVVNVYINSDRFTENLKESKETGSK